MTWYGAGGWRMFFSMLLFSGGLIASSSGRCGQRLIVRLPSLIAERSTSSKTATPAARSTTNSNSGAARSEKADRKRPGSGEGE